jgi:hypothetical protein
MSTALSPTPNTPNPSERQISDAIRAARPDIIFENTAISEQSLALFFENITSKELISVVRNDAVVGKSNIYTPIKNISSIATRYGPKNIVALANASDTYFSNFPIKLDQRIPDIGTGPFGQIVYIDPDTNDLVINVINLRPDEQIEVQIMKRFEVLDDTIYTGGFQ